MAKRPRYVLWLMQSESDSRSIAALISSANFAQACFYAQQAAEKALKAVAFFRGADLVKSHALTHLVRDLKIDGDLAKYAPRLDLYYLTARYPDALPEGSVPSEEFTADMAEEAQRMAASFIAAAKSEIES